MKHIAQFTATAVLSERKKSISAGGGGQLIIIQILETRRYLITDTNQKQNSIDIHLYINIAHNR